MMKNIIIGILIIFIIVLNGCAVSDYLTGDIEDKSYSLLTEKEAMYASALIPVSGLTRTIA